MKKLMVALLLLLTLVMGYAAGGASAAAAGVAPKAGGAGDAWVGALLMIALLLVGALAWRFLRRPRQTDGDR